MLVFTPRTRNSSSVRSIFWAATASVGACADTFTSIESKNGEITTPWYTEPSSRRMPKPPAAR